MVFTPDIGEWIGESLLLYISKYLIYMLKSGAGDRSRTYDLRITNALLYQLSYTGTGRGC